MLSPCARRKKSLLAGIQSISRSGLKMQKRRGDNGGNIFWIQTYRIVFRQRSSQHAHGSCFQVPPSIFHKSADACTGMSAQISFSAPTLAEMEIHPHMKKWCTCRSGRAGLYTTSNALTTATARWQAQRTACLDPGDVIHIVCPGKTTSRYAAFCGTLP